LLAFIFLFGVYEVLKQFCFLDKKNVQRKQRHWQKIIAAKKCKRKQEKERRKANRAENPGNNK
jgi:hypothetical protein